MRNKKQTINLLKKELIQLSSSLYEYHTPKNLIITITTKKNIKKRNFTFGGSHWSASLVFSDSKKIYLSYFSPLKKPQTIKIKHIKQINFYYLTL